MKRLPDELRQQAETLLRTRISDAAVSRETGVPRGTVTRWRNELGLPSLRITADSPACRHGHPWPENMGRRNTDWAYCRACARARKRAWLGPAQPDEAAIERAAAGDRPERLTPRERHAAIARLDRLRMSAREIAEVVGCSKRTVHRARSKAAA